MRATFEGTKGHFRLKLLYGGSNSQSIVHTAPRQLLVVVFPSRGCASEAETVPYNRPPEPDALGVAVTFVPKISAHGARTGYFTVSKARLITPKRMELIYDTEQIQCDREGV